MRAGCYTGYVNARMRVTGHLRQGWFGSVVMDQTPLAQAETTGRPAGGETRIKNLERQTARRLKPQRRGPKGNA